MKTVIGLLSVVAGFSLCIPAVFRGVLDGPVNGRVRAGLPPDRKRQTFALICFIVGLWTIGFLFLF